MSNYLAKIQYRGGVAVEYDERRSSSDKWRREIEIIESIVAEFEEGLSILDVPMGTGRFLQCYEKGFSIRMPSIN